MLAKINWIFLIEKESYPSTMSELVNQINAQICNENDNQITQVTPDKFDAFQYLNNKEMKGNENAPDEHELSSDFWQMNFPTKDEVLWDDFRAAFLKEYKDSICDKFGPDRVDWFCRLLFYDIFEQANLVNKSVYKKFIGDKDFVNKDIFYQRLRDYGIGMLAMKEVFDMKSSVRITAVQGLGFYLLLFISLLLLLY